MYRRVVGLFLLVAWIELSWCTRDVGGYVVDVSGMARARLPGLSSADLDLREGRCVKLMDGVVRDWLQSWCGWMAG